MNLEIEIRFTFQHLPGGGDDSCISLNGRA